MTQSYSHGTCSRENYDGSCQCVGHFGGMESKYITHMALHIPKKSFNLVRGAYLT